MCYHAVASSIEHTNKRNTMLQGANSLSTQANIVSFDDVKRSVSRRSARTLEERARDDRAREARGSRAVNDASYARLSLDSFSSRQSTSGTTPRKTQEHAQLTRSSRESARDERNRARSKKRADKLFERQFGGSSADYDESAPRAALYKGQMGSRQRKSARMQKAASAAPARAAFNPAGWFSNFRAKPRTMGILTAIACLVFICAFLYTPAQQYYMSVRENARLQAEYEAVQQRNETLADQNEQLASASGQEDAVRQKYGYVKSGEQTANVSGLSDATVASESEKTTVDGNVLSSSIEAPETWYSPVLDVIFGVE